jgi:hypothetical protein
MNEIVSPSAMIPIVFPPNPTVGDTFDAPNGITYTWDGVVWVSTGSGGGVPPITGLQYKGPWQVATNMPDITVAPQDGECWTAQTQNYLFAEQAPAGIPGLGGMTIWNGWVVQYVGTLSQFVAYNTMTVTADDINQAAANYVLKAGDTMEGILNWDSGVAPGNAAITITDGTIRLYGTGAVAVMDQGEIRAPVFVAVGDPAGYVFGTTAQDGGLYKKLASGITLRQSSGDQQPQIELNDGSAAFDIIDARGGDFPRIATNVALSWSDTVNVEQTSAIYQDSVGNFVLRKQNTGFAAATCFRTRAGNPARLELLGEPEQAQDAATKGYVDTALGSIVAFQGTWQVASNTPDLDPVVAQPIGGWYWLAVTVDPSVPETAPIGLPGIGGQDIGNGDMIVWSDADSAYHDISNSGSGISKPEADTYYVQLAGSTMTGPLFLSGNPTQDTQAANKRFIDQWCFQNKEIVTLDLNTLFTQGMYMVAGGTNVPVGVISQFCFVNVFVAQTYIIQELYEVNNTATPTVISKWVRYFGTAIPNWTPWAQLYPVAANGTFIGIINASNGAVTLINSSVTVLPDASTVPVGSHVVCIIAGQIPSGPAIGVSMQIGDWLLSNGTTWNSILSTNYIQKTGDTMLGSLTLAADPIANLDAATKQYVDNNITGAAQYMGVIDASQAGGIVTTADGSQILLPPPSTGINRVYVICTVPGTFTLPVGGGPMTLIVGDQLYCNGTNWSRIAIGGNASTASAIAVTPQVFGTDNVQDTLEFIEDNSFVNRGAFTGDLNTLVTMGTYVIPIQNGINKPPSSVANDAWVVRVFVAETAITQEACEYDPNIFMVTKWQRTNQGATWQPWQQMQLNFVDPASLGGYRDQGLLTTGTINNLTVEGTYRINTVVTGTPPGIPGAFNVAQLRVFTAGGFVYQELTENESANQANIISRWARMGPNWGAWIQQPITAGAFLPLTGGTLTGPLRLNQTNNPAISIESGLASDFNMQSLSGGTWTLHTDGANGPFRLRFTTGGAPQMGDYFAITSDLGTPLNPVSSLATFTGRVASAPIPTDPTHLVNKAYVDNIVASATVLIGSIDAVTGDCQFIDGSTGPVPAANRPGEYLICINPGTIPSGPAQGVTLIKGDWLWDNGTLWFRLEVGSTGTATTADSVALIPPVMGASDLQSFAAAVNTQLLKINGTSTMTGPLLFNQGTPAPPSATVRSSGTKASLYSTGTFNGFDMGIESGNMWFNTQSATNGYKLYFNSVHKYTIDQNYLTLPAAPAAAMHAANKQYVDAGDNVKLALAGGTMTGGLSMSGTFIRMQGNSANIYVDMANNSNGTSTPVIQFRRLDGGRMAEFRAQQIGYNNNAEAQARLETMNGGWGWLNAWRTNVNSPPQVYFDGNISAGSVTNRCLASDKANIQDPSIGEHNEAWDKLHVRKFKMKEPAFDWGRERWGFIAEELPEAVVAYAAPGSSDPAKMVKKVEGIDLAQALALTVAKVKELEERIEALQANLAAR